MALIFPHEHNIRAALSGDLASQDLHDICQSKEANALVLKMCNEVGKKSGFKGMELLEAVVLTPEEWTPENGLTTAAHKINRKKIAQKYTDEIKAVYPY
jgi:long-chain acyl-CoA synthetase